VQLIFAALQSTNSCFDEPDMNLRAIVSASLLAATVLAGSAQMVRADGAGPLFKLLQNPALPAARKGFVVNLVCQRGNAEELQYILQQCVSPKGYQGELQIQALDGLREATVSRNVKPAGNLADVASLLKTDSAKLQKKSLELIRLWKVTEAATALQSLAFDDKQPAGLRKEAVAALIAVDPAGARKGFEKQVAAGNPIATRYAAAAALVRIDAKAAAPKAVAALRDGDSKTMPSALLQAFLDQNNATQILAAEMQQGQAVPKDVAKLGLRYIYSVGRSDAELVSALNKAAGISDTVKPLSPAELKSLVAKVDSLGDASRGEAIFRRKDLSCMKCHAVSGAGGNIGPDLSAVGGSSPLEYIVTSIMFPDAAIKEAFTTHVLITEEGAIYQGIVVEENEQRTILRDANGVEHTVLEDDIDERDKGRSLMPQGLVNFLTDGEFRDLAKFIGELGKPGKFAVRTAQTVQRWRRLKEVPAALKTGELTAATLEKHAPIKPESAWAPVYGKVAGELPLDEFSTSADVVLLRADLEVTTGGEIKFAVDDPAGVTIWGNGGAIAPGDTVKLAPGTRPFIFRINRAGRKTAGIRVVASEVEGSGVEFKAMGGI